MRISDWSSDVCSSDLHISELFPYLPVDAKTKSSLQPGRKIHRIRIPVVPRHNLYTDADTRPKYTGLHGHARVAGGIDKAGIPDQGPGVYEHLTGASVGCCRAGGRENRHVRHRKRLSLNLY